VIAMPAAGSCELLEWDSSWFGVRIGRVHGRHLTADRAEAAIEWAAQHGVACLYFLADADDGRTVQTAERHGFSLTDVRLELVAALDPALDGPLPASIRAAREGDLARLKGIARASHHNTRFYVDGRFDRTRCDELYARWIERSVAGELADAVWVPEAGGEVCGYLTARASSAAEARIGLVAIDSARRGCGHGAALLRASKQWYAAHGVSRLAVVTQGRNGRAISFYERAGFTVRMVEFWYHRWSNPQHMCLNRT
jgi:dTDP-4-amino-4,6-dideoxy-D-galactose acyltransferase